MRLGILAFAAGILLLQQQAVLPPMLAVAGLLVAGASGLWLGARLLAKRPPPIEGEGNPQAQAALGISARELAVLHEIAAGHSNKEIAARLHVSPNTVKTHVARLLEKLGAKRRTEALRRARELGLMP